MQEGEQLHDQPAPRNLKILTFLGLDSILAFELGDPAFKKLHYSGSKRIAGKDFPRLDD